MNAIDVFCIFLSPASSFFPPFHTFIDVFLFLFRLKVIKKVISDWIHNQSGKLYAALQYS